jgi:sugar phosphate permease
MLVYAGTTRVLLLLLLGPLVAFFGTGFFSGFGTVAAELFPTAIRATAQGFTFNMGRFGSALAPLFVGSLADKHGFSTAFALLSVAFAVGAMTWIWLPETRGRSLT